MKQVKYEDSLQANFPEMAKEWHSSNNGNLIPADVHQGASLRVWWLCPKGHAYEKEVFARTQRGQGCPICRKNEGCLAVKRPDLIAIWDFEKNGEKTPYNCYATSKYMAWWKCPHGHSYQRSVVHNCESNKCPTCIELGIEKRQSIKFEDSLEFAFPEIAKEWHPTKNGESTPATTHKGSSANVWWLCSNGHEYQKVVRNRTIKGQGCPVCRVEKSCLATIRPDLVGYWDSEKNGKITPYNCLAGSEYDAFWICEKGHSWQQMVYHRVNSPLYCPYCNNYVDNKQHKRTPMSSVHIGIKDTTLQFSAKYPDLLKEWDYSQNLIDPDEIPYNYSKGIWWRCSNNHSWHTSISQRLKQAGCPYCRGRKIWPGYNDFASRYPELLGEWDYEKNSTDPKTLASASRKKYHWICPRGHEYEAALSSRTKRGTGCPYCANQKLLIGFNDFETLYPNLAAEWDYEKNEKRPFEYIGASETYAWWKCKKGHSWRTMISTRVSGTGCPICAKEYKTSIPEQAVFYYCRMRFQDAVNRYQPEWIGRSEVDVYIPSLKTAVEFDGRAWHKDYKKDLRKNELCNQHGIRVFRIREPGIELFDDNCIQLESISYTSLSKAIYELLSRLGVDSPCVDVQKDLDNILAMMNYQEKEQSISHNYPHIAAEWDYEKNSKYLSPGVVNANSKIMAHWICPQGHHYEARVEHRTRSGSGCPYCSGKKVLQGYNDLASQSPLVAEEWSSKNIKQPNEIYVRSHKKYTWKCKSCNHEWECSVYQRTTLNTGCPKCSVEERKKKVTLGENGRFTSKSAPLSVTHPMLLSEWDYEKNGEVLPESVSYGSEKTVWWICPNGHSYESIIKNRTRAGSKCPICHK